ncbi:hypothetical protein N7450_005498 [Penicillium hetheringtonii]|uniref:Nudix hydrolase domain-containing protein n=1 Tax=Penicillium hetheringtonii TaxID=911720 RepID=A0AAD6GT54_9EURO|nr:hypothetical protein N7450_005498 [Penicillium hetheringtonii]
MEKHCGMQMQSVVSSFIFTKIDDNLRVALFQRSKKVTTYQGHLAPISGTIEAGELPIQAAWRELQEETSLAHPDIKLWRQGQPFTFDDIAIRRRWTIYPFAFYLSPRRKRIFGWIGSMSDGTGTVQVQSAMGRIPRASPIYQRASGEFAASEALSSGIHQLKTDHLSGSHELTSIAIKNFRNVLIHLRDQDQWWDLAREAAWHLWKNGRESMGTATLNAFINIFADMESILPLSIKDQSSWDRLLAVVNYHLEHRRETPIRIKDAFIKYLQEMFLPSQKQNQEKVLHSTIRDSIIDAFSSLPLSTLDLRILESRPLFEGASMASAVLSSFQSKHPTSSGRYLSLNIYTDASAALAATNVDFVLLGADQISSSGWVSNKTGSLPAVLSAKAASPGVKILVLSGLDKVAGSEEDLPENLQEPEINESTEVTAPWVMSGVRGAKLLDEYIQGNSPKTAHCMVSIKNVTFEWVPAQLIDGYLCENGLYSEVEIQQRARDVKRGMSKYFGV